MISKTKTLFCIFSITFLILSVYANPPLRGDFVQQGELFIDDEQFEKGFFQLLLGREALEVAQDVVFATEVKQNLALLASLPQPQLTDASTTPSSFFFKGQANGTTISIIIYDATGTPIATAADISLASNGTFEAEVPYDTIVPLKLYYAQLTSQNDLLHSPPLFIPIVNNHFSRKLFNEFPDSLVFHEFSFILPQEFTAYTILIEQDGALIESFTTQSGFIQRPLADGTYTVTLTALQETTEVLSKTFTFTVQSTLPQATLNDRPLLIPSQEIVSQNIMLQGLNSASYSVNNNPLTCSAEEVCDHTLSLTDTNNALTVTNEQGQYTTTLVAPPSLPAPQLTSINPWLQETNAANYSSSRKHVLLPYGHFPRNGIISAIPRQYILPHALQPGINKIPLLNEETIDHTYVTYVPEELHIQTTYTKDAVLPGKEETFTLSDADSNTLLQVYHNGETIAEITGPTVTFQLNPKQGFNALVITLDGETIFNDIYFYETSSPEVTLLNSLLLRNQDVTFLVNHTHNLRNFTLVVDDTSYTDVLRKGNFIQFDHSFTPGTYTYTLNALDAPTQETIELTSGSFSVQNLSLLRITDAKNTPLISYGNTLVQAADSMRISFNQDVIFQKLLVNTIPVTNYGLGNNILTLNLSKYPVLTSLEFVAVDIDGNSYTGMLTMNNHTPEVTLYGIFSWNDDHSVLVGTFPNDFIFWDTLSLSSNAQTYVSDSYFYSFFNASSLAFLKSSTILMKPLPKDFFSPHHN